MQRHQGVVGVRALRLLAGNRGRGVGESSPVVGRTGGGGEQHWVFSGRWVSSRGTGDEDDGDGDDEDGDFKGWALVAWSKPEGEQLEAVAERLHPEIVIYEAESLPFGGEWKGKDALQRLSAAMYGTWAEAKVEIHEIIGGETYAAVILSLTMTSKKTQRTFTQTLSEVGKFEDGLLRGDVEEPARAGSLARRARRAPPHRPDEHLAGHRLAGPGP